MKVRLRKSDEVFEATRRTSGFDVDIAGNVSCLTADEFHTLFEPVPEPESEEEKLAKLMFAKRTAHRNWSESWDKNLWTEIASAVLAAGYTPPKPVPVIEVGSRVLAPSGCTYPVSAIEGDEAWLRREDGSHATYKLAVLTLVPEEDRDG